jgi:hypothetical protein
VMKILVKDQEAFSGRERGGDYERSLSGRRKKTLLDEPVVFVAAFKDPNLLRYRGSLETKVCLGS